jgi:hypothetical protein
MRLARAQRGPVLEYEDTAVGPLPRGPAADAALAAAAAGTAAPRRVAPLVRSAAVALALAAVVAVALWRRSSRS